MKHKKLIREFFKQGSPSGMPAMLALLGGLAAGVVLGVLFAPQTGGQLRSSMRELVGNGNLDLQDEPQSVLAGQHEQARYKRPKSDIKSLLHQAHTGEAHTEQGLSV